MVRGNELSRWWRRDFFGVVCQGVHSVCRLLLQDGVFVCVSVFLFPAICLARFLPRCFIYFFFFYTSTSGRGCGLFSTHGASTASSRILPFVNNNNNDNDNDNNNDNNNGNDSNNRNDNSNKNNNNNTSNFLCFALPSFDIRRTRITPTVFLSRSFDV